MKVLAERESTQANPVGFVVLVLLGPEPAQFIFQRHVIGLESVLFEYFLPELKLSVDDSEME